MREQRAPVVIVADAQIYAGVATGQTGWRVAGVLERMPRYFEEQTLLRIHARRLARRDAEQLSVETIDVVEEGAVAGGHLPSRIGIGVVKSVERPTIGRNRGDRIGS
jgi:hypothetical protein